MLQEVTQIPRIIDKEYSDSVGSGGGPAWRPVHSHCDAETPRAATQNKLSVFGRLCRSGAEWRGNVSAASAAHGQVPLPRVLLTWQPRVNHDEPLLRIPGGVQAPVRPKIPNPPKLHFQLVLALFVPRRRDISCHLVQNDSPYHGNSRIFCEVDFTTELHRFCL